MQMSDKLRVVLDANLEIERTLCAKRKLQRQQETNREQPIPTMVVDDGNRPLKDYAAPNVRGLRPSITRPK